MIGKLRQMKVGRFSSTIAMMLCLLAVFSAGSLPAHALPGALDTSFDSDGKLLSPLSLANGADTARAMAIQSDGKIVVAGTTFNNTNNDFAVVRYNSDGTLDTSFGTGGKVVTAIGSGNDNGYAVALDSSGNIVVAGSSSNGGNDDFAVVRYTSSGQLDSSFGTNGVITTAIGTGAEVAQGVAIDGSGNIVLAGYSFNGTDNDFAVASYTSAGALDSNFGNGGTATAAIGAGADQATAVATDSSGNIVLAGSSHNGSNLDFAAARFTSGGVLDTNFGSSGTVTTGIGTGDDAANAMDIDSSGNLVLVGYSFATFNNDFAIVSYTSSGSLNPNFGGGGKTTLAVGSNNDVANAVTIDSSDRILVAGYSAVGTNNDFAVVRYHSGGFLDSSFGTNFNGRIIAPIGAASDVVNAIALDSSSNIVLAGSSNNGTNDDFALTRYLSWGELDANFGINGKLTTAVYLYDNWDTGRSVVLQPDGKIVVVGYTWNGSNDDFAVARYNSDGSFDTTFGEGGKVSTAFGTNIDQASSVVIDGNGNIVVAGYARIGTNNDFAIARFTSSGALDTTFSGDGKVTTTIGTSHEAANAVAIDSNGKIVAAGFSNAGSNSNFAVVRYNTDGSLDTSFGPSANGKVTTPIASGNDVAGAIAFDSNNNIVVAGYSIGSTSDFSAVRYTSTGALDTTFDTDGKVIVPVGTARDQAYDMVIDDNGNIVLAGVTFNSTSDDFAVVRLTNTGALDSSFSGDGKASVTLSSGIDYANGVAIDHHDNIVLAGVAFNGTNDDFALVRFTSTGLLDTGFGTGGKVITTFSNGNDVGNSVVVDQNGNILVAGYAGLADFSNDDFALARYDGGINTPPVTAADSYNATEDTTLTVAAAQGVLANDTDAESVPLTAILDTAPATGTLTLNADGSFTYVPVANANGTVTFTYKSNDGINHGNIETVTINIAAGNDLPVATADTYNATEDTVLNVAVAEGVLANDSDLDNDTLSAIVVDSPTQGTLNLNTNGSFSYTPATNYNGPDSFSYKVNDGTADGNTVTVSLTVAAQNDAPVTAADSYNGTEDTTLTVAAAQGVLANDTDVDSVGLTAQLVNGPATGTLTLNADGSFTYVPVSNANGTVTFTYEANDGTIDGNVETVTLNIAAANDVPVAVADSYTATEDITLTVAAAQGLLANDSDIDGNSLTATVVTQPAAGTLNLAADGSFTYAPAANANGTVTFTYKVNDGTADGNTETVTIEITAVNDAPALDAISDPAAINEDAAEQTINLSGISAGPADESGQTLTLTATSNNTALIPDPAVSTITGGAATLKYTPVANAFGTATITVTLSDGQAANHTTTRTFTITVNAVNDAPVANADNYNGSEDATLNVSAADGVLDNDSDIEGNTLQAIVVSSPASGNLTLNADGSFSYVPAANANGAVTFTYKVNDGSDDSNTATVTIDLASDNDLPTISAIDNLSTAQENATDALAFTIGDVETPAGNLTLSKASSNPALVPLANIVFGGSGTDRMVTVTPAAGQSGNATISITVTDGDGGTASETFLLTVIPRPIIVGFNPATGGGWGTTVQITISNHATTGPITGVTFNGLSATFTQSGSLITATVPSSGTVGGFIRITSAGGTGVSPTQFTFIQAPVVGENFSPAEGGYGDTITISGLNLQNTSGVKIGNFTVPLANITQVNASQIKIAIPVGSVTGKISVTTPGGTDVTDNELTVHQPPQVNSFSPGSGNIGTLVTISGSHLSSTQLVRFNTQHTTNFTVLSNNQIRVAVPAGATTGKITVQTKGGQVISAGTFTVILRPSINSFTPATGAPGTLVTLSGNNLSNVSVAFNGVPAASITPVSAFQVRAVVPASATTGRITATNAAGDVGTSGTDFVVLQAPTISALNPTSGQVGTGVTISGANFTNISSVKFNGIAATFTVDNSGQITTTVPVGATTGKITVANNLGTGTSAGDFTVLSGTAPPAISSFSPTSGAAGSTVVINGTGFLGATSVQFTGANNTVVNANFRVDSAQKITATVPANAITGPIHVTTPGGTVTSSASFTVLRFPVIFSFTPTSGPATTSVLITGANFTGTTAVRFTGVNNTTVSTPFTLQSPTQIRCNVPLAAITGKISVTNGFGTGQSSTDFVVSPRVESFSPTSGPVGTVVTINGRAFVGVTAVQFNGELAEFTVVSPTRITATVPVGATSGVVTVTTESGVGNSTASFTVTP